VAVSNLAVVTGAGSGIGRATAIAFAERGLDVALLGRRADALEETARAVRERGRAATAIACDVSIGAEVDAAARSVLAMGAPSVVVCNAGIAGRRANVVDTTEAEWDAVLATNLKGTFLVAKAFLAAMLAAKRGRVVCVSSISATLGTPGLSAYVASKWGVVGFVKSLAEELRGTGLQAMSVLPGTVDTPMQAVASFPIQMQPEDVARTIVFAALDAPDAMNGSSIEIFGP
jgi:3-oxoacyl-[acyl-carrier protein] reductase